MKNSLVVQLIILLLLVFSSPAHSAIETGAAPPADDETLIYVMRVGRFVFSRQYTLLKILIVREIRIHEMAIKLAS